jgi:hypothetical protein
VPGAVGAFLGATALSALSTENAAPYMAGVLLALGVYVLVKFSVHPPRVATARVSPHGARFLSPLGLVAGFVDASGGGGWGPVATPALLTAGRTAPRTVVGSVDTSEFVVALAASVGFLVGLGSQVLDPFTVGGLLLGGVLAAPVAAWLVTRIPAPVLGSPRGRHHRPDQHPHDPERARRVHQLAGHDLRVRRGRLDRGGGDRALQIAWRAGGGGRRAHRHPGHGRGDARLTHVR